MYVVIVLLTMLILPVGSVVIEHARLPTEALVPLIGRWFVFWGVGVRLGLAGLRQVVQPRFTAQNIFHMSGDEALPIVRELGVANLGTALIALISLAAPNFVLPAAITATLFFGFAGAGHMGERDRSLNENIAMVSDIFIAVLLLGVVLNAFLLK